MPKENTRLYFYAVCLEYENGAYYYRYEKNSFSCEENNGTYYIEKRPDYPFYIDSSYSLGTFNAVHGKRNHWYAYVVCPEENECLAKELLAEELERRHRQALGIANAATAMLDELGRNSKEEER